MTQDGPDACDQRRRRASAKHAQPERQPTTPADRCPWSYTLDQFGGTVELFFQNEPRPGRPRRTRFSPSGMIHWIEPFAPPSIPREPRQRTAWTRNLETPLRLFLRDQTFAAVAILAGIVVALIWANIGDSYEEVWRTAGTVAIGPHLRITQDLRAWINEGLMSLFFFTVGLEARREFDLGELRDRRRLMLPLTAGLAGMGASVLVFFLIAGKHITGGGWGVAMSTDTAFSLAMLAVAGRRFPLALRAFILTVQVVDDVVGLLVIALALQHGDQGHCPPHRFPRARDGSHLSRFGVRRDLVLVVTGVVAWVAFARSGVDPVVVGLVAGLLTTASGASREELEEVTDNYRRFREQPTSEFNRDARASLVPPSPRTSAGSCSCTRSPLCGGTTVRPGQRRHSPERRHTEDSL